MNGAIVISDTGKTGKAITEREIAGKARRTAGNVFVYLGGIARNATALTKRSGSLTCEVAMNDNGILKNARLPPSVLRQSGPDPADSTSDVAPRGPRLGVESYLVRHVEIDDSARGRISTIKYCRTLAAEYLFAVDS
jgi:hypothetical protein